MELLLRTKESRPILSPSGVVKVLTTAERFLIAELPDDFVLSKELVRAGLTRFRGTLAVILAGSFFLDLLGT